MRSDQRFFEKVQHVLEKAQAGSVAALNHLIAYCVPFLRDRARRQLRPPWKCLVSPSELVQQTCLRAFQKIHSFRGRTARKLLSWLCRIQQRQFLDIVRRSRLKEQPLKASEVSSRSDVPLIDPSNTPRTAAIKAEQREAVKNAVGRLPKHYQDVIRLYWEERITFEEIARILDLQSEDAARGYHIRALRMLMTDLRSHNDS